VDRAKFIPIVGTDPGRSMLLRVSGNAAGYAKQKGRKGSNMLKKLLGAVFRADHLGADFPSPAACRLPWKR
jgi:hypothetical protein